MIKGFFGGKKQPRLPPKNGRHAHTSSTGSASPGNSNNNNNNASVNSRQDTGGSSSAAAPDSGGGDTVVFKVKIPDGVRPGEEFQVHAGGRVVRVRCPPGASPGQALAINVPRGPNNSGNSSNNNFNNPAMTSLVGSGSGGPDDLNRKSSTSMASSNGSTNSLRPDTMPSSQNDSPGVTRIDDFNHDGPQAYMVEIPVGIRGGQQFPITISGNSFMVTCPPHAVPGNKVRIVPPPPGPQAPPPMPEKPPPPKKEEQTFEVVVPSNVKGGQAFALLAGGVRVQVVCPVNAVPGQKIRFRLPLALTKKPKKQTDLAAKRLSYDKDGWTRTVRVTDMNLQWIRMDEYGGIDDLRNARFDTEKSAYVRKLVFREGSDPRIRDGVTSLVPAYEAVVDSKLLNEKGETIVDYPEIADAQAGNFEDKAIWFQSKCTQLAVEWNEGHMRINVRREHLLEDSVDAVMSLNRKDLRKMWRFEFIGEAGIDAGGLAREWFHLVSKEIFDPDMGFWCSSDTNQMLMEINPASSTSLLVACSQHFLNLLVLGQVSYLLFSCCVVLSRNDSQRLSGVLPVLGKSNGKGYF